MSAPEDVTADFSIDTPTVAEPSRSMAVEVEVIAESWRCELLYPHKLDSNGVDHCLCPTHKSDTAGGHCEPCCEDKVPLEAKIHRRVSDIESLLSDMLAGTSTATALMAWDKKRAK